MLSYTKDRLLKIRLNRDEQEIHVLFVILGILVIFLSLGGIYLFFFFQRNINNSSLTIIPTPSVQSTPSHPATEPTPAFTPIPTPTAQPTAVKTLPVQQAPAVKDYFIPLGSGTNQTEDWADVPGVQATVDFGQYESIKEIRFEASVNLPTTGQFVYVRLFNKTDKHPVWYSDVATTGDTYSYLTSKPLAYDQGEKLYQVQMKTQLKAPANLAQSRIHVTLK